MKRIYTLFLILLTVTFSTAHADSQPISWLGSGDTTELSLYPNPTNGIVHMDSNAFIDQVKVYSLIGEVVMQSDDTEMIDLSDLPSSLYFIEVKMLGGETVVKKILKK